MTPELVATMHVVMQEAVALHHDAPDFEARTRGHILDRWYRFEPFGVKSRKELEPIQVTSRIGEPGQLAPGWSDDLRPVTLTTVEVKGTPLEGR